MLLILKSYFHKFTVYIEMKRWCHNDSYKLTPKTCACSRLSRYELEDESHKSWILTNSRQPHPRRRACRYGDETWCMYLCVWLQSSRLVMWHLSANVEKNKWLPLINMARNYRPSIWTAALQAQDREKDNEMTSFGILGEPTRE